MSRVVKSGNTTRYARDNSSRRIISSNAATRIIKSNISVRNAKSNLTPKAVNSKIGKALDTSRFRWHKTPTPATNGAQLIFTIPDSEQYVSGLLEVFLDGLIQTKDVDYTETTSTTFTMTAAPDADETLRINYIRQ